MMTGEFNAFPVRSVKRINASTLWIELDHVIQAQPGQFVMAWLPGVGEKPFSIAGMDPLSLLVVDVGPVSHALHQLQAGDRLWIKGPLGHGYVVAGHSLVLVGGGYGAAPLLPLAKEARAKNLSVWVCLGARNQGGLLLMDEFQQAGCQVTMATEDGSAGKQGLVTGLVETALDESDVDCVYACGPGGMLSALARLCTSRKVPYQLSWEAHMRCGMGLCGSCEVPQDCDPALPVGWLACYDGPVFRSA